MSNRMFYGEWTHFYCFVVAYTLIFFLISICKLSGFSDMFSAFLCNRNGHFVLQNTSDV